MRSHKSTGRGVTTDVLSSKLAEGVFLELSFESVERQKGAKNK